MKNLPTTTGNNHRYNVRRVMQSAWSYYRRCSGALFSECLREAWQDERDLQPYYQMLENMANHTVEHEFGSKRRTMTLEGYRVWRRGQYCRIYLDLGSLTDGIYIVVSGTTRDEALFETYDDNEMPYPFYGSVSGSSPRKRRCVCEAIEALADAALDNVHTLMAA